ncbi:STAS domain-containing protein [Actinomadura parmotrematis]|uniref:Anti-sigma factor antagonist n=1 Tax=Actinomadura parmotrematis TaxID=2864039 RepID=A0ABS7FQK5_9ACTN|nr:STAS domain-containing protein [Actinomadura parmotrematis]MBW8482250.1 STAS domain-containing protein [Actinomadura parmotrematis]
MDDLAIECTERGGAAVLTLAGSLSFDTADDARDALRRSRPAGGPPRDLVVDVGGLEFIDSAGVQLLLDLRARAAGRGGALLLAGHSGFVTRVLDLTGLQDALPVHPTVEDALGHLPARDAGG